MLGLSDGDGSLSYADAQAICSDLTAKNQTLVARRCQVQRASLRKGRLFLSRWPVMFMSRFP